MVRLDNGTRMSIRYLAEHNGTPKGGPILCVQKTSRGWPTASSIVRSAMFLNPSTGKTNEYFFLVPGGVAKPGDRFESLETGELRPGQQAEFFIRLEPGALPVRVGTICYLPQGKLAKMIQPWLSRV